MNRSIFHSSFAAPLSGWARKVRLILLTTAAVLSCGMLAACQSVAKPEPQLVMDVQYYDQKGSAIEIPTLALPDSQKADEEIQAINRSLAQLKEQYQPLLDQTASEPARCLFYPTESDRYLSLVLYQQEGRWYPVTSTISSWVYDKEEGRQLTLEDAFTLADTSEEALADGLLRAIARNQVWDMEDGKVLSLPGIPYQTPRVQAFRICPDGQVEFFLYAAGKYDVATPFLFRDGTYRFYPQFISGESWFPLIAQEELTAMSPALWSQWYFGDGEPEGGYSVPPDLDTQALLLARLVLEDWEYLNRLELSVPLHRTQGDYTLILVNVIGAPHVAGLNNLILGIWDEKGLDFVGEPFCLRGDDSQFSFWEEPDGSLYLLCANTTTYAGYEGFNGLAYFRFQGGELTRIYQVPDMARYDPAPFSDAGGGEAAMLYPLSSETSNGQLAVDFWAQRKAIPSGTGFDLYQQNPDFDPFYPDPDARFHTQWYYVGYIPFADPQAQEPDLTQARPLILDYYQKYYAPRRCYFLGGEPGAPREGDMRIDDVVYMGEARTYETCGVACQLEISWYETADGVLDWHPAAPTWIVLGRSGYDGTFQEVRGIPNFSTDGMTAEEIIDQVTYRLMDLDVCLYRDGWPTPVGPGNCPDLFNPAYETEQIEVLDGWEPAYQPGDYWDRYSVEGFTALRYYIAAEDRWSANTIDVTRTDFSTPRNIRVGSSRADVLEAYPTLYDTPYWHEDAEGFPKGDCLWYCDSEEGWGPAMLFFFEGDTVRQIRLTNMFD